MTTRGLKINNPGNIRIGNSRWQGKIVPSRDPAFETFDTLDHGIRAVGRLLLGYFVNYDLDTIRGLVSRYAPANENDTEAYIEGVCDRTGFEPDVALDLTNRRVLISLVHAFIDQEQGAAAHAVTSNMIDKAVGPV